MELEDLIRLVNQQCHQVAYRYRQDAEELISHCRVKIPGLLERIDHTKPIGQQRSFVRKSINGYCYHWLRDCATIIKTPRNHNPIKVSFLNQVNEPPRTEDLDKLPEWVNEVMENPKVNRQLKRRFANAYRHLMYD